MFSNRLPARADVNALSRTVAALRAAGTPIVDLTESNPTTAGFAYPADLLTGLADPRALRYDPQPCGLRSAREAVADDYARRGVTVDPAHVVLSASTSEAYSWLFKLLCSPGEAVLVPQPSYPLFEHLTRLEAVRTVFYGLEYHGRWEIDLESVAAAPPDTRVLLLVSPNNPTGSYVSVREMEQLVTICRDRQWAIVADEVFAEYVLDAEAPATEIARDADVLSFTLGGASKSLGLPQVKLAWMLARGPAAVRDAALSALELVADTFLSVSTPVQVAAPDLLRRSADIRTAIHHRVARNLAQAREVARRYPSCDLRRTEGGWSTVIRVPATRGEERLVLDLVQHEQVLVHPGFFFDLPHEAFLVVSLLPPEHVFAEAFDRVLRLASS
ncbi:MAG TPA: pyridoxal phosphate-dependent aminotransferase [Vicinamibacterales bacterium]|nr:pyridoxal phosphate-dependent aminotransferase [Vicinamibacterales bacterium]